MKWKKVEKNWNYSNLNKTMDKSKNEIEKFKIARR